MKRIFSIFTIFVFTFVCSTFFISNEAYAGKKKKKGNSANLVIKARDGSGTVYGSVLNSKQNEVKIKLPASLLSAIRKEGLENISVNITKVTSKAGEASNIYSLSTEDSLDLFGKILVINLLSSLTDVAGSTYTAGALPEGKYELTVTAGEATVTGNFEYKPPVVVVGNVTGNDGTCSGGTQQVNAISGDPLSRVVALSDCSYFNEVPASRVTDTGKTRTIRHQELSGGSDTPDNDAGESEPPQIGISIANTADGDVLKAAIPLNSDDNGQVQYDIDPSTTEAVDLVLNFAGDDVDLSA